MLQKPESDKRFMSKLRTILMAEDNPKDAELALEAFSESELPPQ